MVGKQRINFKAQSNIIAVVLLILIVLIAVAITWVVIKNLVQKESDNVDVKPFLLGAEIEDFRLLDNYTAEVKIKRTAQSGNITGVKFVLKTYDNNVYY